MIRRYARLAYPALIWLFAAAVLLQVFFAGLGLFAGAENWPYHINFGYLLHLSILPVTIVGAFARLPRPSLWMLIALFVVTAIQPLLPLLRNDIPAAAALHPVLALVIFSLAAVLSARAMRDVREERDDADTTPLRGTA